jgi:Tfp pilus assembly protein PilO
MSKLSKEKRDRLILVTLGAIGVAGILYTFVLSNQKDELFSLQSRIASTRDKLSKAERLAKNGRTIEETLSEAREKLAAKEKDMVPEGQEFYTFFKLFDQFRHQSKLETSFIGTIGKPEFENPGVLPKAPYKAAVFPIKANGYYHQIGKFISDFENAYPYMRLQTVHLQPEPLSRVTLPQEGSTTPNENLNADFKVVAMIKRNSTQ